MSKSYNIISMAGAVLLLAGAVLQITRWELAPYLYTLGAVMFGYVQVMGNRYDGRLSSSVCVDSRFSGLSHWSLQEY